VTAAAPAGPDAERRRSAGAGSARAAPGWLVTQEAGRCTCTCIGRRRKGTFVDKTIRGAANVMREALFADDVAAQRGLLQAVEPRVKLVTLLALLVTASLVHGVAILAVLYAVTLGLAAASGLPVAFFVKRVWLFVPLFTGAVVLPATLNLITPGDVVVPLGTWFGREVGLTAQGLSSAALLVTRVATSVSIVVLLTLTTRWTRLLAAARALFVPQLFVLVLGMAYRYLFHLLSAVTDMYEARKARTVDSKSRGRSSARERAFVAASAGALFGKAHALSDEVYMAMVARGFDGEVRTLAARRPNVADAAFAVAGLVAAVALVVADGVVA
jgi:cobalt/nickel transport system permease protein